MKPLRAAYRVLQARPSAGVLRVHLFTDEPLLPIDQVWRRMLAPWADWVRLSPARPVSTLFDTGALGEAGVRRDDAVVVITEDAAAVHRGRGPVENLGARYIVPDAFPPGSRDADFVRELFHFDFEFGGLNDGAATLYGAPCLRQLSATLARHGYDHLVEVATREGTRQNWDQFHQTDVFVKDDALFYCHKDTPEVPLLSAASGLRLRHIQVNSTEWLACTLEKR